MNDINVGDKVREKGGNQVMTVLSVEIDSSALESLPQRDNIIGIPSTAYTGRVECGWNDQTGNHKEFFEESELEQEKK